MSKLFGACRRKTVLWRFRPTPGGVGDFISSSLAGLALNARRSAFGLPGGWMDGGLGAYVLLYAVWRGLPVAQRGWKAGSRFEAGVRLADDVGSTTTSIIRI